MPAFKAARQTLLRKRDSLLGRYAQALREENELLSNRESDPPDLAADRTAAQVLDRLSDAELHQLQRIGRALQRIEAGTYGTCVVCRQPIVTARLKVLPEAERCATCTNSH
jgi:RNA polymerase-binding transcription factor DksA